jgi:hypothetical protein
MVRGYHAPTWALRAHGRSAEPFLRRVLNREDPSSSIPPRPLQYWRHGRRSGEPTHGRR